MNGTIAGGQSCARVSSPKDRSSASSNWSRRARRSRDVCRQHSISEGTYYRWKAQYGGLEVSQLRRLRQLEEENRKLKQIVADLTLDNVALKEIATKNW